MRIAITIFSCLIIFGCKSDVNSQTNKKQSSTITTPIYDTFLSKKIVSYQTNPNNIDFFLKDDRGNYYNNHGKLLYDLNKKDKKLAFAMNGGMYLEDYSPQGLYIENGKLIKDLNSKKSNYGNFYLAPNGIFYITKKGKAQIKTTQSFVQSKEIKYATQSGPMLLINGSMHPAFTKNSKHVHIRNGVGILPDGNLLFAMSKDSICFYDFASFFEEKGCKNALYLDGAISKTYLPSKGIRQTTGKFGVIIAEVIEK